MPLAHAILGFLQAGPLTGYDLKTRCFDGPLAAFWTADQAQVYRTLERLQESGLVSSRLVPQRGKPDRKTYELTPPGQLELRGWLSAPHALPPLRDPLLLQVSFAARSSTGDLLAVLGEARDAHQGRLDALRKRATNEAAQGPRMALRGAMSQTRAAIDWLDDCIEEVARRVPSHANGPGHEDGEV